ncbi:MAG TPA: ABC transporter permease [Pseudonocardiaceae bacterium]|jgi:ABC-2 type transport system permease protein|nr:ABC transporter permease [Pseudonocardiaceae bacterium]
MPHDALLRTRALVHHNTILMLREPGPLASRLLMPLVAVLVFEPLYRAATSDRAAGVGQAVTGMLVLFSLLALSIVGTSILTERSWHTWDRLRATPLRAAELLVGKAVPVLGMLLTQQVVVLGFGVAVLGLRIADVGLLAVAVLVWSTTLLCVGAALGTLLRSQPEFAAVQDIGSFVSTSLGGALVPIADMPGWARHLAPVSPAYWAMSALRGALAGEQGQVVEAVAVLLAVAAAAAALAAWRINRGFGRSTRL